MNEPHPNEMGGYKDFQKWVAEIRKLIRPTHVKRGHIPRWVTQRLAAAVRKAGQRYYKGELHVALRKIGFTSGGNFLDHWGSVDRGTFFVSEPYPYYGILQDAVKFAELLDCAVTVDARSEYNPPGTIRLEFVPKQEQMP